MSQTLIHRERHLAAAAKGGARPSANSNSQRRRGDVTNLLKCEAIIEAISGNLVEDISKYRNSIQNTTF